MPLVYHSFMPYIYRSRNAVHSINYIITLQESAGHDIARNWYLNKHCQCLLSRHHALAETLASKWQMLLHKICCLTTLLHLNCFWQCNTKEAYRFSVSIPNVDKKFDKVLLLLKNRRKKAHSYFTSGLIFYFENLLE